MEEMKQQIEVSAPKSEQAWRGLMDWVSFLIRILTQIIIGTPTFISQVIDNYRHRSLLGSSSSSSFKQLPVYDFNIPEHPLSSVGDVGGDSGDQPVEKLTVVLDLDETLICAYETSSLPAIIKAQASEAGLKWFELECMPSEKKDNAGNHKVNYVTVFERPGLRSFLKQLSEFADIVLFTAGLEGYARPLVDKIDVENKFSRRLYRPSTISTEYREHVKDLTGLSNDIGRIVIVDNNPYSFLLQPLNGIPCIPFSVGQPYDNQLLEVLLPLLKHLSTQKDVRPALDEIFRMPEWFQMHGIPASAFTFTL